MILGRFYFKQTQSGNLLDEFSNNKSDKNSTESADLNTEYNRAFIGDYSSTWFEAKSSEYLSLNISEKVGTNGKIFSLKWIDKNKKVAFYGEGFLNDNILIGNYWDDKLHQHVWGTPK